MRSLAIAAACAACAAAGAAEPLFKDGFAGWRTLDGKPADKSWRLDGGELHLAKPRGYGGSLITEKPVGDFELTFRWKIADRKNSGIKYRVKKYGRRFLGCEYQIFGDVPPDRRTRNSCGSLYGVFEPAEGKAVKPGEWNTGRIVVRGDAIEHWVNGRRVVSCRVGSEDWKNRIARSKFRRQEGFGAIPKGHLLITDHRDEVRFRDLKIVKLP